VVGVLLALGLVVVFSFGLSWVYSALGLVLRSPSAVLNGGFMVLFPLTFMSNVFVDPATLPGPLQAFVDVNPISVLATASRSLMAGSPDGTAIAVSLAVAAALTAVFLPITTRLYRSR
jgi:ABC-2 type transport system permease protein